MSIPQFWNELPKDILVSGKLGKCGVLYSLRVCNLHNQQFFITLFTTPLPLTIQTLFLTGPQCLVWTYMSIHSALLIHKGLKNVHFWGATQETCS